MAGARRDLGGWSAGSIGPLRDQRRAAVGPRRFPWSTFAVNVSGCLLIGVLMVLVTRRFAEIRLLRPFAGVGFLGGFTTFSTYALDIRTTIAAGRPGMALLYLGGTLLTAVTVVWVGTAVTERVLR